MTVLAMLILLVGAYLVGSIPFSLILGVVYADVDVREVGSGNPGATNVARSAGKRLGAIALLLDLIKGLVPVMVALQLSEEPRYAAMVAMAAVVGHCYPIFLEFRGGKGVATACGVLLAVTPWATLAAMLTWGVIFGVGRRSSLASLGAVVVMQIVVLIVTPSWIGLSLAIAVLLVWRHRGNIQRLVQGTEARIE